ncbi:MAG: PRD domain-containing protein, partial [Lachnospiraceae bacterium]|nr:PRD domain-containing protein [Lachnospiraceae bacterium]
ARLSVSTEEIFEERSDQSIYGITKALVSEFEKVACVTFTRREELERALFIHIRSSMYRYQYGIQIGNPMTEDVVREYPNLFELTRRVTVFLEQMINLPIPDAEVAYLALHFGAFLKTTSSSHARLRILIVCSSGVSTGNMLRREVEKLLPEAEIVDVLPASRLINVQEKCDLVISTVRISTVVPVLVVHPILTDEDRRYILSNSMVAAFNNSGFSRRLFDVVSKYVDPADHEALQKDIALFLAGSFTPDKPAENERALGLPELLDLSRIRMVDTRVKWTDAVYLAGEPLLHNGSIIEHYLDAVVTQTMYYGPYMFITDHIMLAHAKPEDGVNRRDVSLASFKEPVLFPAGRQAKIIIVLSAEDNEKHLKILNDLLTFAEDEENLKALEEAESAAGILALFREKLR